MTVYKCKMCDAILHISDNEDIVTCEYCGAQQSIQEAQVNRTQNENTNNLNADAFLKRAFMFLEEGNFERAEEYCEKVLDLNPECAEAYLGKLMAELHISKQEKLKDCKEPFDDYMNYKRFMQFANSSLAETIAGYITHISERNEAAHKEAIYQGAVVDMKRAYKEYDYKVAAKHFESISDYKDSKKRAKECRTLAQKAAKEQQERDLSEQIQRKKKAKKRMILISLAVVALIAGFVFKWYWDSVIVPERELNKAIAYIEGKDYEEAYSLLEKLDYKNSRELLIEIAPMIYEERLSNLKVGDTVFFGMDKPDTDESYCKEIEWLVLDENDGRILLVSKYALSCRPYDDTYGKKNWKSCSLRTWLNSEFLDRSFNSYERNLIVPVYIKDEEDIIYDFSEGMVKMDQVFLLSQEEVCQYELDGTENLCKGTEYLKKTYRTIRMADGVCEWWIRSYAEENYHTKYIGADGRIYEYGYIGDGNIAVRPVLWISVE